MESLLRRGSAGATSRPAASYTAPQYAGPALAGLVRPAGCGRAPIWDPRATAAAAAAAHRSDAASSCTAAPCMQRQPGPSMGHKQGPAAAPAAAPAAGQLIQQQQHQQQQPQQPDVAGSHRAHVLQQQQVAEAGVLLEQAAAVPRAAGPPPEPMAASTSTSSGSGSSSSSWSAPRQGLNSRRGSSSNKYSAHSTSWRVPADALLSDVADAHAAAAADTVADALAAPPHWSSVDNTPSSRTSSSWSSSSSSGGGRGGGGGGAASAQLEQRAAGSQGQYQQQQRQHHGSSAPQVTGDGWLLMQQIHQDCKTCEDVASLLNANAQLFTAQHSAAALYHLADLWQQLRQQRSPQQAQQFTHASKLQRERVQMQQLAGVLLRALCARMQEAQLRDLADAWYAVDALGMLQPGAGADSGGAAAAASSNAGSSSSSPGAGGGAATAAAVAAFVAASLQHSTVLFRRPRAQLRHLSRLLTSLAHVGLSPSQGWWAAALDTAAGLMEQIQQQQQQHTTTNGSSSSRQSDVTSHANAQAVALVGWAVAELQAAASPAWWQLFHAASRALMPVMRPSHLSNCLYACAVTQQPPDAAWFAAFYAACRGSWRKSTPQGFATTLWALAALQQQPPAQWLAECDAASATALPGYTLQHMGISLWALARLHGSASSPPRLQQQQQQPSKLPSAAWQDQAWAQLSRLELDAQAPQGLACLLWGVVRLQLQLPQARLQELERMCCEVVRHMDAHAIAMTVWALGRLRGTATSRQFIKRLHSRCSSEPDLLLQLPPQGLCMLLCGLSSMDAWQPDSLKQSLLAAVTARVQQPLPDQQQQQESKKQRRKRQQQEQQQQQEGAAAGPAVAEQQSANSSGSSTAAGRLEVGSLPLVLMYMRRLRIAAPPALLCDVQAQLQQQLPGLPLPQLCLGLFALGAARHAADAQFVTAALLRVEADVTRCSGLDAAHALFGLATMSSWGGGCREALLSPDLQAAQHKLVAHAQQALPHMDSRALAMLLWALGRLQLQPSEPFLQAVMASTLVLAPNMSLLSMVTILAAFRALHYLPPLQWMVAACGAARAKVGSDGSGVKPWQQRHCVRRFEETVAWYNQALQQQTGVSVSSMDELDGVAVAVGVADEQQQAQAESANKQRQRARMDMLQAAAGGSEAVLAAAVGVAAAVAQQWRW